MLKLIVFLVALYVLLVPMKFGRFSRHRSRDYSGQLIIAVVIALSAAAAVNWCVELAFE